MDKVITCLVAFSVVAVSTGVLVLTVPFAISIAWDVFTSGLEDVANGSVVLVCGSALVDVFVPLVEDIASKVF